MTPETWLAELEERDLLGVARNVARAHGLRPQDLVSKSRGKAVCAARAAFYGVLSVNYGWSHGDIGRLVGRDVSTVREALRRHPPTPAEAAE
jgi:chromosomal replication initiation ATPase DnaA